MTPPPDFSDHLDHLAAIRHAALRAADPYRAVRTAVRLEGSTLVVGGQGYELSVSGPGSHARHSGGPSAALRTGVGAASAEKGSCHRIDLKSESRVFVAGAGKGGVAMARALADVLGSRLTAGVVAVPRLPEKPGFSKRQPRPGFWGTVEFVLAGHPLLDEGSLEAGRKVRDLLAATRRDDLVLAPISGGGSALLELPRPGLTLTDLQTTNELLLRSGATIQEINVVRQRLSQIKGGGLARMAAPAPVAALILSDVVGDPLHLIASGPTVIAAGQKPGFFEKPGFYDPLAVVERYHLTPHLPPTVLTCLQSPVNSEQSSVNSEQLSVASHQSPIPNIQYPVTNLLIGSNALALRAAAEAARRTGFRTTIQPDPLVGEAREAGRAVGEAVKRASREGGPVCLIWGGETTVTVRGQGKGGRNQEVALGAARVLRGAARVAVMAVGTDGVDGPTDAAGAIVTGETVARGEAPGRSAEAALANNDAYTYLEALGALVFTGPTGTNVNDLTVGLEY